MKAYNGGRNVAPFILNLGTWWQWVVNITPWPLYPRERNPIPIEKEASWAQQPIWTVWREKYLVTTAALYKFPQNLQAASKL
jgi:hypothetical protein